MFSIKNLTVKTKDKEILNNFNIEIDSSEIHAIMGPNGTGKSTLSKVIMGSSDYEIESGTITFNGQILNNLTPDERARMGLFLSFQNPLSIEGVSNSEFLRTAINNNRENPIGLYEFIKDLDKCVEDLSMPGDMIHRSVNKGASGGERKKNEILQMKLLKPKFLILDELDSGLDVDSLKVVCENVNQYLEENPDTMVLIITHYTRILEYIRPTHVSMMKQGKIVTTSDMSLAVKIEKEGYGEYIENVGVGVNSMSGNDVYE